MLVSMRSGLAFPVSEQFAQPRVVKKQPAIFVHDQQRRRTELQDFTELALVLGSLGLKAALLSLACVVPAVILLPPGWAKANLALQAGTAKGRQSRIVKASPARGGGGRCATHSKPDNP